MKIGHNTENFLFFLLFKMPFMFRFYYFIIIPDKKRQIELF